MQHEDDAGLGRLEPDLAAPAGVELDLRRPYLGDPLPADLTGYDALLVLGGAMSATDDEAAPWLPATRRLLVAGVEAALPTIGICLGAQLLAVATGGRAQRAPAGLEVGLATIRLLPAATDDPLLGPLARRFGAAFRVASWHQDEISELPAGAVLLATGDHCAHQAFRLGDRAWGLQYHPEVTAEDFAEWMDDGHGSVRRLGLNPEQVLAELAAAEQDQAAVAVAHVQALLDMLLAQDAHPAS